MGVTDYLPSRPKPLFVGEGWVDPEVQWAWFKLFALFLPLFLLFIVKATGVNPLEHVLWRFRTPGGRPRIPIADARKHKDNYFVFLDVAAGDVRGRLEILLFAGHLPRSCEHFRLLCTGEGKSEEGEPRRHYKGSGFHTVIPGLLCQGGKLSDVKGGQSMAMYGKEFQAEWEPGIVSHSQPFLVSLVTAKESAHCASQFAISCKPTPQWDGRGALAFGEVIGDRGILAEMEKLGSKAGAPTQEIKIVDCGVLKGQASAKSAGTKKDT